MVVIDKKKGLLISFYTLIISSVLSIVLVIPLLVFLLQLFIINKILYLTLSIVISVIITIYLTYKAYLINSRPLIILKNSIIVPCTNEITDIIDVLTINPLMGLFHKKSILKTQIVSVRNGISKIVSASKKVYSVEIEISKKNKSIIHRIVCSDKEVRDKIKEELKKDLNL